MPAEGSPGPRRFPLPKRRILIPWQMTDMARKVYFPSPKPGPPPDPEAMVAQAAEYADGARRSVSAALSEIVGTLKLARDSQDPAKVDAIMKVAWLAVESAVEAASYSAAAAQAAAITKSDADKGAKQIYDPEHAEGAMKNAIEAADLATEYAVDAIPKDSPIL